MDVRLESHEGRSLNRDVVDEYFAAEIHGRLPEWKQRLVSNPRSLGDVERDVHRVLGRLGDHVIGLLLADVTKEESFEARIKN